MDDVQFPRQLSAGANRVNLRLAMLIGVSWIGASTLAVAQVDEVVITGRQAADPSATTPAVPDRMTPIASGLAGLRQMDRLDAESLHRTAATRLEDVAMLVPSLVAEPLNGGLSTALKSRGFAMTRVLRDGLPDVQRMYVRDLDTVAQVDLVRGPTGVEYGVGSPGGTVNLLGVKPPAQAMTHMAIGMGSHRLGRVLIDAGGPLASGRDDSEASTAGGLRWRGQLIGQDGESDVASLPRRHQQALAALEWHHATGWWGVEYQDQRKVSPFPFGTVITNGGGTSSSQATVAWDRLYVLDGGAPSERRTREWRLQAHQRIDSQWHIQAVVGHATVTRDETLVGYWTLLSPQTLSSYWTRYHDDFAQTSTRIELRGSQLLGGLLPEVSAGVSTHRQGFLFNGRQRIGAADIRVAAPDIAPVSDDLPGSTLRWNDELSVERGVWVSPRWRLGAAWELVAGLRRERYAIEATRSPGPRKAVGQAATSARSLSLAWQPVGEAWHSWLTTATGMEPNRGTQHDGSFLPAQQSRLAECGWSMLSSGWTSSLAAWRIDLDHLAMTDPTDRTALRPAGARSAEGLEASTAVRLGSGSLQAFGSRMHSWQRAKTSASLGNHFVGTPDWQAGLAGRWAWAGALDAMGPTLWLRAAWMGPRAADTANTVWLPRQVLADAGVDWRSDRDQWALRIRNLTDKRWVQAVSAVDDVFQGPRREWRLEWARHW